MSNTESYEVSYGLLDRRLGRIVSAHYGQNALARACTVAHEHELTGYLSVVRTNGWGEPLSEENLRPAWYAGRISVKVAA